MVGRIERVERVERKKRARLCCTVGWTALQIEDVGAMWDVSAWVLFDAVVCGMSAQICVVLQDFRSFGGWSIDVDDIGTSGRQYNASASRYLGDHLEV